MNDAFAISPEAPIPEFIRYFLFGFGTLSVLAVSGAMYPLDPKAATITPRNRNRQMTGKPKKKSEELPWYKDGLKFKCTGCGDCCTGAPGFVWVNKKEIAELAELMGLDVKKFEKLYVRKVGARKSLKERANYDCVFLQESRKCGVYSARPRQCRTWPFWDSNIRTPEAWELTCEICPGSGKGKLHQLDAIEQQKNVMKI